MNEVSQTIWQLAFAIASSVIPLLWASLFCWPIVAIWRRILRPPRRR